MGDRFRGLAWMEVSDYKGFSLGRSVGLRVSPGWAVGSGGSPGWALGRGVCLDGR